MKSNLFFVLFSLIFFTSNASHGQSCNCKVAFEWSKTAFEQNDAGFQYIVDQKGKEAYEAHNKIFQKRAIGITDPNLCTKIMQQWAKFFRVGHYGFIVNLQQSTKNVAQNNVSVNQYKPYANDYDSNTVYLRIPTFSSKYKSAIDSMINGNFTKIRNKRNLIIDIRDNGGGDDASFNKIIPLLYTNPIRNVSVERLSTINNNKFWQELASGKDVPESDKALYTQYLSKLNASLGKFVLLHDSFYITKYDVKEVFPINIAIIINKKNGSTAEQFLLTAKQSKKVKLFGTTTLGELDISNMYSITSPDGKYTLWYCMSKSLRIPDNIIDNKGIAPDFFIDKSIPKEKWLKYVSDVLNEW